MSVPFELVDEEEMQAIEAALRQASAFHRSRMLTAAARAQSSLVLSVSSEVRDIEDSAPLPAALRFPLKKSLCVTDMTALEWCEKQVEFSFLRGKPPKTSAMQAGSARHVELESEVVKRVDVDIRTREDFWAVRFINYLVGTRQLLAEGLTRELPIVAFVEGNWWTGIIDELMLPEGSAGPRLIDTKTRLRQSLPSDAQKRNGRLQLMCYKRLWDTLCEQAIPLDEFFSNFELDPLQELSLSIRSHIVDIKLSSKVDCLKELLGVLQESCTVLPLADQLLKLRYEWQVDRSLIGEEEFMFDPDWLKQRIQFHLQFWNGSRESHLVSQSDEWKCRFCAFADRCKSENQR
ncbi:exonuclease V, chloroplastic [Selaginella moellendorffii]|uniref:exonuclease V, chloroplastic n=1 Tax=Selaginella moellendorffii TaxID=88036 RepID=UPI000D1CDB6F|nr:exonuclease V, chloroplastic [Selaginella moellendorffii]|eukprot:XP_024534885.1 exonuclease V, chloroplastic [Selaginella moellendorffii]